MKSENKTIKKALSTKYREFQLKGLLSYGKYLEKELLGASKSDNKKKYKKYLEVELEKNKKLVSKVNAKLEK